MTPRLGQVQGLVAGLERKLRVAARGQHPLELREDLR